MTVQLNTGDRTTHGRRQLTESVVCKCGPGGPVLIEANAVVELHMADVKELLDDRHFRPVRGMPLKGNALGNERRRNVDVYFPRLGSEQTPVTLPQARRIE